MIALPAGIHAINNELLSVIVDRLLVDARRHVSIAILRQLLDRLKPKAIVGENAHVSGFKRMYTDQTERR
jgi:hypothetical protein